MAVKITTSSEANGLAINADHEALVANTLDASKAGFVSLVSEKGILPDDSRVVRELEASEDYRLRVENDNILFSDYPTGTALNTSIWTAPVTSQTVTVGGSRYELNSSGVTNANYGSMIRTWRTFQWYKANSLYGEFALAWTVAPVANWNAEWGFFNATTAIAAITDGAYFQIANHTFRGVFRNNSVETHVDLGAVPAETEVGDYVVELCQDTAYFWRNSVLLGKLNAPSGQFGCIGVQQVYFAARTYNSAVAPAVAIKLQVSCAQVSNGGADLNRLWPTVRSGMGGGSYQVPTGATAGQTANWANSAAVTAIATGSLVNTAGSFTGLGGQFFIGAPAAADTDYNIMKYLVPAGNTLVIRGVRVDTANLGAVVATTGHLLQWGMAVGSTADTLAGTESATVKIRRIIPLGLQSFAVGAAIGAVANTVDINLDAPVVVHGGEYVSFALKVLVGTATASQTLRGLIMVNGYFE